MEFIYGLKISAKSISRIIPENLNCYPLYYPKDNKSLSRSELNIQNAKGAKRERPPVEAVHLNPASTKPKPTLEIAA